MFPPVCFSCGRPIGHLWEFYFKKIAEHLDEERKIESSVDLDYTSRAKFRTLAEMGITSECCRRMFICQVESIYKQIL
jgi:DNA-directed RNA polymerase subunit N (RpoN/RPB10)